MKIVINSNGLVSDAVALAMVAQIVDREDGTYKFNGDLTVTVKTAKIMRSYTLDKVSVS